MRWGYKKVGEILKQSGNTRAGNCDYPVLSITMHEGLVDQSSKFKKRIASRDTASYKVVYANELVVGFPIDEGVLGFQTRYPAGIVSPAYGIWKLALPEETHIPYLEGYLRSGVAREIYASKMRGGVARRRTISKDEFLDIDIPFPPLDEQKRIAAMLDKADALRRQRQESLQLTEKLLQSVFIDMFGDPETNPKGLPTKLLGEVMKVTSGNSLPGKDMSPGGTFPVFGGNGISGYHDQFMFEETRIVIGRVGAYCGSIHITPPKSWVTDNALYVDKLLMEIEPIYLAHALRNAKLNQYAGRAAQPLVSGGRIYPVRILIPSPEDQKRFCLAVESYDRLNGHVSEHFQRIGTLFSSLQQRAFRGELDLSRLQLEPETDPPAAPFPGHVFREGIYNRPGYFIAPPEIETQMMAYEEKLDASMDVRIPWSEDYFKYRTLSQLLTPPFNFQEIMAMVEHDMEEIEYDTVKEKVFEYVAAGLLEQQFDEKRREIVFHPRP